MDSIINNLIRDYSLDSDEEVGFVLIFTKAKELGIILTPTMKLTFLSEWRYRRKDGSEKEFPLYLKGVLHWLGDLAECKILEPSPTIVLYIARLCTMHVSISPSFLSPRGLYKTSSGLNGLLHGYKIGGDNSEVDLQLYLWIESLHDRGPRGDYQMMKFL